MKENETIADIATELRAEFPPDVEEWALPVRKVMLEYADRIIKAHTREVLAAVQDAGRIHAACVRAGCAHSGEAVCPGGSGPNDCDHYQREERHA